MAVPGHTSETGFSGELDPHAGRPPAVLRTDFKVLQINEYLANRPEELDLVSASRSWAAKPPSRPFELSDSKR
jgi:hypothetical protein